MTKKIVYQGDDGVAKVVTPSPSFLNSGRPLSDLRGRPKDGRVELEVEEDEIESDRTFRNAWELDETKSTGKATKTNMPKAKEIAKERVRLARKPKFEELDVKFQRAQEEGADTTEIVNKKKKLRDATEDTRIKNAKDDKKLKANMEEVISEIENT